LNEEKEEIVKPVDPEELKIKAQIEELKGDLKMPKSASLP